MLFDNRCSNSIKNFSDNDSRFREFCRASRVQGNDEDGADISLNFGPGELFEKIPREAWSQTCGTHQRALSRSGIYNFSKYAAYTLLFERDQLKDFFNFAKQKGYSCVYTTN